MTPLRSVNQPGNRMSPTSVTLTVGRLAALGTEVGFGPLTFCSVTVRPLVDTDLTSKLPSHAGSALVKNTMSPTMRPALLLNVTVGTPPGSVTVCTVTVGLVELVTWYCITARM